MAANEKKGLSLDELVAEAKKLEAERNKEEIILGDFDPFAVTKKAAEIQTVYDSRFGLIRFGELSFDEAKALNKIDASTPDGKQEKTAQMVHKMLQKAYPELTLEQVKSWPIQKVSALSDIFGHRIKSFLRKEASTQTPQPSA